MLIHYIFDVDGTLTPSRQRIDAEFKYWFKTFCQYNDVYVVTGSDREKTIEQLTPDIYNKCKRAYQCSGNDVWEKDKHISSTEFKLTEQLYKDLNEEISNSRFYQKNGNHIEERDGLANFSIPGRGINLELRSMYRQWDEHKNERYDIAKRLAEKHSEYEFKVAGETGIDISYKGNNKSMILKDFEDTDTIYFFGDKTLLGGNDHEIALAVSDRLGKNKTFTVSDWRHTWKLLRSLE